MRSILPKNMHDVLWLYVACKLGSRRTKIVQNSFTIVQHKSRLSFGNSMSGLDTTGIAMCRKCQTASLSKPA